MAGDQTSDLVHVRVALYKLNYIPSPDFLFNFRKFLLLVGPCGVGLPSRPLGRLKQEDLKFKAILNKCV